MLCTRAASLLSHRRLLAACLFDPRLSCLRRRLGALRAAARPGARARAFRPCPHRQLDDSFDLVKLAATVRPHAPPARVGLGGSSAT